MKTFLRILGAAGIALLTFFCLLLLATIIYPGEGMSTWYAFAVFIVPSVTFIVLSILAIKLRKRPVSKSDRFEAPPSPVTTPPVPLSLDFTKEHIPDNDYAIPRPAKGAPSFEAHLPDSPVPVTQTPKLRPLFSGAFYHIAGLNLPSDTKTKISYWPDRLTFVALNQEFSLSHSKVRSVTKTTQKEIQRQYVSSAGGAIAGAALFGAMGAVLAGGAKQKTIRNYSHYLIFAYGDPGEDTKYLVFSCTDWGSDGKKFVSAYKKQLKETRTVVDL